MASLLQSPSLSSAVRKQSSSLSLNLTTTQINASTRRFSTVPVTFSHRGQIQSQSPLQSPSRPSFSRTALPTQQSRTFLAKLTRRFPATAERHSSSAPASPVKPQTQAPAPPLQLTNLPYFVRRTPSNQLPVYLVTKAGGTKQQTKIQKTEGDLEALRNDLARALGLDQKSPDVTINRLNGHIVVKGWRKPEIQKFLLDRNF